MLIDNFQALMFSNKDLAYWPAIVNPSLGGHLPDRAEPETLQTDSQLSSNQKLIIETDREFLTKPFILKPTKN
jgi:hypothetical protein